MIERHPCLFGLLTGLGTHAAVWLALYAFSLFQFDIGVYFVLILLLARLILFFCLNLNALGHADTWRRKICFACTFILSSAVLLGPELYALSVSEVLSFLDPHSTMFTGLAFVLMWFAVAIEVGMELVIAALQTLIHVLRSRRPSEKSPSNH